MTHPTFQQAITLGAQPMHAANSPRHIVWTILPDAQTIEGPSYFCLSDSQSSVAELDLRYHRFISPTVLASVVRVYSNLSVRGIKVQIINASNAIQSSLNELGFDSLFFSENTTSAPVAFAESA